MRYLLVIKDHLSRIVYARPLAKKEVNICAFEISHHFSFVGYPLILHTDNGSEFGDEVLRKMKEINPEMICVRGRARKPNDQGSVERGNKDVKDIIASSVLQRRRLCVSAKEKTRYAWTTEYQHAMRSMNCSFSRGTGNIEPYEIVFGQRFHAPMIASLKTRKDFVCPETLEELRQYLSLELVVKYKSLGYFHDDDIPDVLHSTAEISDTKNGEVNSGLLEVADLAGLSIKQANSPCKLTSHSAPKKVLMSDPEDDDDDGFDDDQSERSHGSYTLPGVKSPPPKHPSLCLHKKHHTLPKMASRKENRSFSLTKAKRYTLPKAEIIPKDLPLDFCNEKPRNKKRATVSFAANASKKPRQNSLDSSSSSCTSSEIDLTSPADSPVGPNERDGPFSLPVGSDDDSEGAKNKSSLPEAPVPQRRTSPRRSTFVSSKDKPEEKSEDSTCTTVPLEKKMVESKDRLLKKPPPSSDLIQTSSILMSMRKMPPPSNDDSHAPQCVFIKEEPVLKKINKRESSMSIEEAFEKHNSDIPSVCATLTCGICGTPSPFILLSVFRQQQIDAFRQPVWLTTEFVCAFLVLQGHESHVTNPTSSKRTLLFHCQFPEDDISTVRTCGDKTDNIITYAHTSGHYSLLQFSIATKEIVVHDGFREGIMKWQKHAHYVLKKFGLLSMTSKARHEISTTNSRDSFETETRHSKKWTMKFSGRFKQVDSHSCGPLCCATAWELFNGEAIPEFSKLDHASLRQRVIDQYVLLVQKYIGNDSLRVRKNPLYIDVDGSDNVTQFDLVSDDDVSLPDKEVSDCLDETLRKLKSNSETVDVDTPLDKKCSAKSSPLHEGNLSPGSLEICNICLSLLKQTTSSRLVLPCSHSAHISCLRHWAETSTTCPVCRETIPNDFIEFAKAVTIKKTNAITTERQVKRVVERRKAVSSEKAYSRMVNETRARERQQAQSKKMMKRAAKSSKLVVGDVVTIEVPANVKVRCTTVCPVGVVVCVSRHKTYAVVVEGGLLSDRPCTGTVTKWFSYSDLRRRDPDCAVHMSGRLQDWRKRAMESKFKAKDYPAITLQKAHGDLIGVKHQGSYICKCKSSRGCVGPCKFASAGTLCHSSCKCNGNCKYTKEKVKEMEAAMTKEKSNDKT